MWTRRYRYRPPPHFARSILSRLRRGRCAGAPADEVVEHSFSPGEEARAVVEGRFLSMRGRLTKMGIPPPEAVLATGGGSNSPAIMQVPGRRHCGTQSYRCSSLSISGSRLARGFLRSFRCLIQRSLIFLPLSLRPLTFAMPLRVPWKILADVFNAPVYLKTVSDAATIGAALRAKHGLLCLDLDDKERSSPPACGSGGASTLTTDNDRCNETEGKYVPFCSVLAGDGDDPAESPSSSSATGVSGASGKAPRKASYTRGLRLAASPRPDAEDLYADMIRR